MKNALLLTLFILCLATEARAAEPAFRVVVNSANPITRLSTEDMARFFLKKVTAWGTGVAVLPVDQSSVSDARSTFIRDVLGKTPTVLAAYWQQQIFSGRAIPPVERAGDSEVLAFVRSNPGAIGYVSASASTEGVKVLQLQN